MEHKKTMTKLMSCNEKNTKKQTLNGA